MARPTTAARRYAEAAFQLALRDGTVGAWRHDLDVAAAVFRDPTVGRGLRDPSVPFRARIDLVSKSLGSSIGELPLKLILLVIRRGRIESLPRIAAEFGRLDDRRNGVTVATATSAAQLEADEVQGLTRRLEEMTGGRVDLTVDIDPGLLGGLVVRLGDRLIDGSVRGRLERLRSQLVSGAL